MCSWQAGEMFYLIAMELRFWLPRVMHLHNVRFLMKITQCRARGKMFFSHQCQIAEFHRKKKLNLTGSMAMWKAVVRTDSNHHLECLDNQRAPLDKTLEALKLENMALLEKSRLYVKQYTFKIIWHTLYIVPCTGSTNSFSFIYLFL